MKQLLFLLVMLVPLGSVAETIVEHTVGDNHRLAWDYVDPLPWNVEGFRTYCLSDGFEDYVEVWSGTDREMPLSPIGLFPGEYQCYVAAYNASVEAPSEVIRFPYVDSSDIPAPESLRVEFAKE